MRAVIFTDQNLAATADLVTATLGFAHETRSLEICGLVTSHPRDFQRRRRRTTVHVARAALQAAANANLRFQHVRPRGLDLDGVQRHHELPVLVPPGGDPNAAEFRAHLVNEIRPDVALTFYVRTIFRRSLIESFEQVINYHDSLLPQHRGLGATSFSMYDGEKQTGFTFHRMNEAIDAGPILIQGSIRLDERLSLDEVHRRKIAVAVENIPRMLERVLTNDPGCPQDGPGSYHSAHDVRTIRSVDHPEHETAHELNRRVRAFGTVFLTIGGARYPVTRLRNASSHRRLSFRTADGQILAPDRFRYMPRPVYELGRRVGVTAE
jgi:methionyl-tRNA formyltransferase